MLLNCIYNRYRQCEICFLKVSFDSPSTPGTREDFDDDIRAVEKELAVIKNSEEPTLVNTWCKIWFDVPFSYFSIVVVVFQIIFAVL